MILDLLLKKPDKGLFDFPGGIHPPEHKSLSSQTPIQKGPISAQLVLPLNMHIGAPAHPLVNEGDHVLKGQKLAEAHGPVSAPVHAPTSGTVVAIGPRPIQHPSGLDALCIVLESDNKDAWIEHGPLENWQQLEPTTLVDHIREAGIAGMGGAGFPTALKVNVRGRHKIEQLIINAVECEPYITADDRLMRDRAEGIVAGIAILQHLIKPAQTLIGIEDNKPEAIAAMKAVVVGKNMTIKVVPTKYPSGGEKQLIQMLTGKEVRSGGLPAEVGVVCQNIGTAWAIHRAVDVGEPLISRITTLTGEALERPGNYEVLLGTPVADLLEHTGAQQERIGRLVMGGPMMGFTIHNASVPVVKTTNCIIAATLEELPPPPPEQPCIRCGACAEVCPANLLPQQLYWYSKSGELDRAQHYNLMDCIECGACAWVCPSNIPLVQYYRHAKGEVRQQAAEQEKSDRARQRFEARQARIDKEKAEKEARRQARLEANRQKQAGNEGTLAVDIKALKARSLEASSAYKTAVKELKAAEAEDSEQLAEMRARVDELKAQADQAKTAVREANAATVAAPVASDPIAELKKAVGEASSAYKSALKAAKDADASDAPNAAELRSRADELKASADQLKADLRQAKVDAPQTGKTAPQPETDTRAKPATPAGDTSKTMDAAERAQRMKALKTAWNMANKQFKEASAALEHAERSGSDDLDNQRARVEKLKNKAGKAKAALNQLVEDAKADIQQQSGADLKTLKLEAARAESQVREKAAALAMARENADDEQSRILQEELNVLEDTAASASRRLRRALDAGGLGE